jgi:hypothetical protein
MIRRLLVVFAVLAATLVGAAPVSASAGTVSQTFHFSSNPLFAAPLPCSPLAGLNVISEDNGNGVIHFTQNSNGFWLTGTYEGDVKVFPAESVTEDPITHIVTDFVPDLSRPTAQGRVADWFGESLNRTIVVDHDAVNAQVTTSPPLSQAISFHAIGHIQAIPAPPGIRPIILHQFMKFSCS